jgi:hypothetical protein
MEFNTTIPLSIEVTIEAKSQEEALLFLVEYLADIRAVLSIKSQGISEIEVVFDDLACFGGESDEREIK